MIVDRAGENSGEVNWVRLCSPGVQIVKILIGSKCIRTGNHQEACGQ